MEVKHFVNWFRKQLCTHMDGNALILHAYEEQALMLCPLCMIRYKISKEILDKYHEYLANEKAEEESIGGKWQI